MAQNRAQSRPAATDLGSALRETLISPNESDSNLEPANVVDGLFAIARAIDRLTAAIGIRDQPDMTMTP